MFAPQNPYYARISEKPSKSCKGSQRYYCPSCQQTYTETFDTIYYRRQIEPEKIADVLPKGLIQSLYSY